jgi:transposase-like protein
MAGGLEKAFATLWSFQLIQRRSVQKLRKSNCKLRRGSRKDRVSCLSAIIDAKKRPGRWQRVATLAWQMEVVVEDSLEEARKRRATFPFTRLPPPQWKSARTKKYRKFHGGVEAAP